MSLKTVLLDGYSGEATICLPPGTYSPFSCGGQWPRETSWKIPNYGLEGYADENCDPIAGSFTIGDSNGIPEQYPTRFLTVDTIDGAEVSLSLSNLTLKDFGAATTFGGALYLQGLVDSSFNEASVYRSIPVGVIKNYVDAVGGNHELLV